MSAKVKLISFISAFVLVLGIMIIGVLSAEQVKVNIGGSVSFNATNVYARVSGDISGAGSGNKTFSTLTYSASETTGDESDWTNLALEFTETPNPIEITITVENLSTQRTLTVNLENTLKGEGLDIAVTRDNGSYTSAANVELPVSTGDGSSTTTFILTLTVANPNEDLTDVNFGYILNLFDENYTPPPTPASSFTFSYSDTNNTASITKFVGSETEVIIPSTVENNGTTYKVTEIADGTSSSGAFYDSNITSVVIPDTVTSIGDYAFESCDSLTSITIPSSVTSIGENAFWYCNSLTSITIPSSVTSIGKAAFNSCCALAEVYNYSSLTVTAGSSSNGFLGYYAKVVYNARDLTGEKPETRITVVGNVQYYNYGDDFIALAPAVARGTLTEVTLDNRTTEINQDAFYLCSSLTSVNFGNNSQLTSIGENAFYYCNSLTSITIPDTVTSIGDYAFHNCSSLTSIEVDQTNTTYSSEDGVLFNKAKTTLIQYPIGNTRTSYIIPSSVTSIGKSAFYYCNSLTSITIGKIVTNIYYNAFSNCCALAEVYNYSPYITVTAGGSSSGQLGRYAKVVYNADDLTGEKPETRIKDNNGVRYYDDGKNTVVALYPLSKDITTVSLDSRTTEIQPVAFKNCNSLTSITIPEGVTSIGGSAFSECSNLAMVNFGENSQLTRIGADAFRYCHSLTSITIPSSVTSIGSQAFNDCYALAEVYNYSNLKITQGAPNPSVGHLGRYARVIYNASNLTGNKPASRITEINDVQYYNYGSDFIALAPAVARGALTDVSLDSRTTRITQYCFSGCSGLTRITINATTPPTLGSFAIPDNVTNIYVPKGSVDAYKAASGWSSYASIISAI